MRYSGTTPSARAAMLARIGVRDVEELFAAVPPEARMRRPLEVEGPVPEGELLRRLDAMKGPVPRVSLVGGGLYHHAIPATVDSLAARSEWVTSYTPYQPEISQGTLVVYYEFQTYVCQLTGHEVANAGMYDGSTAAAEAVLMARRLRPRARRVYVSEALNPEYRAVLRTYLRFQDLEWIDLPFDPGSGRTDFGRAAGGAGGTVAVVLQSPNVFGVIEDPAAYRALEFTVGVVTEALSLALVPPPATTITAGEMQSFGIPVSHGGPTAGFLATRREFVRQMPGRLVGRTVDRRGQEAFCITLATREQFIRRERATSNICTASGLMCLRAVVHLSLLGRTGLETAALQSARAAAAFRGALRELGLECPFSSPVFNEFVVDLRPRPALAAALEARGFLLGLPLDDWYPSLAGHRLVALTELHYPAVGDLIREVKDRAHDS
jgi:glycine dehydrogenase subunit 1